MGHAVLTGLALGAGHPQGSIRHFPDAVASWLHFIPFQARKAAAVNGLMHHHASDSVGSRSTCRPGSLRVFACPVATLSVPSLRACHHPPCCAFLSPLTKQWEQPSIPHHFSSHHFLSPNAAQLLGQCSEMTYQSSRFCIHCVRAVGALGAQSGAPWQTDAILKPRVFRSRVPFFVLTPQLYHSSAQSRTGHYTGRDCRSHCGRKSDAVGYL